VEVRRLSRSRAGAFNNNKLWSFELSRAQDTEGMRSDSSGNNDCHSTLSLLQRTSFLKEIAASWLFLLATVLTASAYVAFFRYLDIATATQVMADASYFVLFYSLIAVSSVLMGLNAYSFRSTLAKGTTKLKATSGSSSAATSLFGSVISCSCHTSLLLPLLASVGLSTISGIEIIAALVVYKLWILLIFIALNLYLAYRVLGKIQRARA
jgi:hypothetical protein